MNTNGTLQKVFIIWRVCIGRTLIVSMWCGCPLGKTYYPHLPQCSMHRRSGSYTCRQVHGTKISLYFRELTVSFFREGQCMSRRHFTIVNRKVCYCFTCDRSTHHEVFVFIKPFSPYIRGVF